MFSPQLISFKSVHDLSADQIIIRKMKLSSFILLALAAITEASPVVDSDNSGERGVQARSWSSYSSSYSSYSSSDSEKYQYTTTVKPTPPSASATTCISAILLAAPHMLD